MPALNVAATIARALPGSALALCLLASGCGGSSAGPTPTAGSPNLGDGAHGAQLIMRVGCGSCHIIPGVAEANGLVGPPLDHIASRQYLAGLLHNTPDNMVAWLRFPQRVLPGNAMPDMGLSEADARDITAYLETLK